MDKEHNKSTICGLPLISVVVPIYNVQKYLIQCINSILSQTYQNLEIILVDDGSEDASLEICRRFEKEDKRINVIHQQNMGLSGARNTGINSIHGQYLVLLDSDDFIRENAIELLYQVISKTESDICVCNYEAGCSSAFSKEDSNTPENICIYSGNEKYRKLFDNKKMVTIVAWCKIYRASLFVDLEYPLGRIHEDEYIAHYLLEKCNKIAYIDNILFYYREKHSSITKSRFSLKRLDSIPALLDRILFINKKGVRELIKLSYIDFLKRFQYYYYGIKYHYPEKEDLARFLKKIYIHRYLESRNLLPILYRLRFALFIYMPTINYYLKKMAGGKSIDT